MRKSKTKTVLVIEAETDTRNFASRALAEGAADCLVKPLSTASLRKTVARILHPKRRHHYAIKKSVCTSG